MAAKKSDPFADTATEEETAAAETETTDVTVEDNNGLEVSVTLKGGRDFDAPWVVVRAQSVGEALAALDEDMQELLKQAAKYGKAFAELGSSKPAGTGGAAKSSGNRAAPGPKDHPSGKKQFCEHGPMDYKSGVTKTGKNQGKTWHAFDCSEGVCDRQWDND